MKKIGFVTCQNFVSNLIISGIPGGILMFKFNCRLEMLKTFFLAGNVKQNLTAVKINLGPPYLELSLKTTKLSFDRCQNLISNLNTFEFLNEF